MNQKINRLYGGKPDEEMFTSRAGDHQRIGPGERSILINESRGGRVLEVNPAGTVVWEYINRYNDDRVAAIYGALRYPEDYFTVTDWTCP